MDAEYVLPAQYRGLFIADASCPDTGVETPIYVCTATFCYKGQESPAEIETK